MSDNKPTKKMAVHRGVNISPGVAIGKAYIFKDIMHTPTPVVKISDNEKSFEKERVRDSLSASKGELSVIVDRVNKELGYDESNIFQVHLQILDDEQFVTDIFSLIDDQSYSAESAVKAVVEKWDVRFSEMDSDEYRMKSADIIDVGKRVLSNLCLKGAVCPYKTDINLTEIDSNVIFITKVLLPSVTAYIDRKKILGIIAELGNRSSHSAVIAKSLGLPSVFGVPYITEFIEDGDEVILDGSSGIVYVNPTKHVKNEYETFRKKFTSYKERIEGLTADPAVTKDGIDVSLFANIGAFADVDMALKYNASGIGLYRTEMPFIIRNEFPNEDLQYKLYRKVVEAMKGRPVNIRTLDLGGDKIIESLPVPREENPNMGWRAIRVFIDNPELFKVQLRAILRASAHGKIRIILPMISDLTEVEITRRIINEAMDELDRKGVPFDKSFELGIMVEVPSAVLLAESLIEEVDFFSVGTNDLIQYTLAVDRNSEKASKYFEPLNPAIIKMLKSLVDVAGAKGKDITICGEIASDPLYVPLLVGLGYTRLSLNPLSINMVKDIVRSVNYDDCSDLAAEILTMVKTEDIRARLNEYFRRFEDLYKIYFHPVRQNDVNKS